MSDFSERLNELLDSPSPMLFGPPEVVDGWCSMEERERGNTQRVLGNYQTEVALWQRALTLLLESMQAGWRIPDEEPMHSAMYTRINLLALEVGSAKVALDMTLAGYYSMCFAAIRHMLEATAQSMYLVFLPEDHERWGSDAKTPSMRRMIDSIKDGLVDQGYPAEQVARIESLYDSWTAMSKGSHPTGIGLVQVIAQGDEERNIVGSSYRPELVDIAFDHGLFALLMLFPVVSQLGEITPEWQQALQQWVDDRQAWRQSVRVRLGLPGDLSEGAVVSEDLQL